MSLSLSSSPDETTPVPHGPTGVSDVERDMLAEARLLRQHKTRLEARMKILEEHNRQLEAQLGRLRQLLDEVNFLDSAFNFILFQLYLHKPNCFASISNRPTDLLRPEQERCRRAQSQRPH